MKHKNEEENVQINKSRAGVITLEIELERSVSHGRRVAVELRWDDMLDLPLSSDRLSVDRADVELMSGPADDEVILDRPNSLTDFTWKGIFRNSDWMTLDAFASMLRQDRRVLNIRAIR